MSDGDAPYDLIVIGGGIHGLMIGLQAVEAGWSSIVLDKSDMGGAASGGWFGILHGGLRYLQSLDIKRFRASLSDTRWFVRNFPEFVTSQTFLMPLYNHGLKRPGVFRLAFAIESALGWDRNRNVPRGKALGPGYVLQPGTVTKWFPAVPREMLSGGATWNEMTVRDTKGLFTALIARARKAGLELVENCAAHSLAMDHTRVTGVETSRGLVRGRLVINAAGAWASDLAQAFDPGVRAPLSYSVRAFNVLLDRRLPATAGLALASGRDSAGMIFAYPRQSQTFAGTDYLPVQSTEEAAVPSEAIAAFLDRLNHAIPGFGVSTENVVSVSHGLLPAAAASTSTLLEHDVIKMHRLSGGPRGLITVVGVKFTTAPSVARRVLGACSAELSAL